jgi:hypothetical protein
MVTHRGGLRVDTGAPGLSHRPGRRCSKTPPPSATFSKLRLIGPLLPGLRTAEAFGAGPPKPGLPAARFHTAALASLPRPPRQTQCAGANADRRVDVLTRGTPHRAPGTPHPHDASRTAHPAPLFRLPRPPAARATGWRRCGSPVTLQSAGSKPRSATGRRLKTETPHAELTTRHSALALRTRTTHHAQRTRHRSSPPTASG